MKKVVCFIGVSEDDKKVLLGKKVTKNSEDVGNYALLGGKIEDEESMFDATIREIKEESNIDISNIKLDLIYKQIITLKSDWQLFYIMGILSKSHEEQIKIMEEDKVQEIGMFEKMNLPKPMTKHNHNAIMISHFHKDKQR